VNTHCTEILSQFTVFERLALALKKRNRVALKIFTVVNILFTFRISEQLALAMKREISLKFFAVVNIFFTIRDF